MNANLNEQWVRIKGHECYEVSNLGHIRNRLSGQNLKGYPNYKGYLRVMLDGKQKTIHRLVAEAFIPNPNNLDTIDHIDGNKLNNAADNLQWMSREDNASKAFKGTSRTIRREKVACLETNKIYDSAAAAARELKVYADSIRGCCKGKQHTAINDKGERLHFMYRSDYFDMLTAELLEKVFLETEIENETEVEPEVSINGVELDTFLNAPLGLCLSAEAAAKEVMLYV